MVRDRFKFKENENIKLKLVGKREQDGRMYNLPTSNEVAALIIGDLDGSADKRDIVLETKSGNLQRISELHPSYLALQYPLLFPRAEDGYRPDILLKGIVDGTEQGRTRLSMREFFAYRIQQRENEESLMLKSRRLFQQFLVDAYTMMENERLNYIRYHQKELRIAPVNSLSKALNDGSSDASLMGNRVIIPSSFTGGTRYMQQNYLYAMTLCKFFGYPDLFITMTCNPKWPEITRFLEEHGLNADDRPDVLSRLFKLKLDHLIKNLKDKKILGRVNAVVYTIEFQKRGLPHAHVCLFLHRDNKLPNPEDIDSVISTEIPHKDEDAELFPKNFTNNTYIDEDGFPVYRRRDTGSTVKKSGVDLDNRSVVGYNAKLLKKYQAHINVEWCNQLGSIKYLFKYINKGPDRICAKFIRTKNDATEQQHKQQKNVDEIEEYYDCRYISACEAAWRIFKFSVHYQTPHVERLSFHLPGQQPIIYDENDVIDDIVSKPSVGQSQFIKWMECNKHDEKARNLTYADFPTEYVWNIQQRKWTRRQGTTAVGRINYVPPKVGEPYYLRILLNKVKGPRCYEDIRKVNDKVYDTYKEACYALGLMDDDKEYIESIRETSSWATSAYCRSLFAMLITSDSLSRPEYVWDQTWDKLSEDILNIRRQELNMPDLPHDPIVEKNIALSKIELLLLASGTTLKNIPSMPYPDYEDIKEAGNVMVQEELNYDIKQMKNDHDNLYKIMTNEQKGVYNNILNAVDKNQGGIFFVYGDGGTGKTFIWKALCAGIRSKGDIVISVASSGTAALLLTGGRTAHSRFKIPINPNEKSFCSITPDSDLAGLLNKAKLIIWDEAPMTHKHCFEALERTLRDILRSTKPFGGKVIVFGGDFRQILPVVQKGSRHDIVNATINHSHKWDHCTVLNLTVNMRLKSNSTNKEDAETKRFADWILQIGEGNVGEPNDGEAEVEFPEDVLIKSTCDHMDAIVSCIYPSINDHKNNTGYFQDKAILAPTNEEVDLINDFMLSKIIDEEKTYFSSDTICETEITDKFEQSLYSPEILNGVKASGIPNHKLTLKKGVPVMLLRNMDQSNGLCNGTRLQIKRLGEHVIEAMIISGSNIGDITYIPRMKLMPSDKTIPFKFNRRQYPLAVCFAMTINKSQGQSLENVGLYLRRPVFSHGQLYVAVSRVKTKKGLKVLLCDKDGNQTHKTTNVVYKEVLQKI